MHLSYTVVEIGASKIMGSQVWPFGVTWRQKRKKGKGRWKEDSLRNVGRTDARTDTKVILYSVQCYALHCTDNNGVIWVGCDWMCATECIKSDDSEGDGSLSYLRFIPGRRWHPTASGRARQWQATCWLCQSPRNYWQLEGGVVCGNARFMNRLLYLFCLTWPFAPQFFLTVPL